MKESPSIASIQESWTNIENLDKHTAINAEPVDRGDGGKKVNATIMLRKEVLQFEVRLKTHDLVAVEVFGGVIGGRMLVVSIYLCPRRKEEHRQLLETLDDVLQEFQKQRMGARSIICGDFNMTMDEMGAIQHWRRIQTLIKYYTILEHRQLETDRPYFFKLSCRGQWTNSLSRLLI